MSAARGRLAAALGAALLLAACRRPPSVALAAPQAAPGQTHVVDAGGPEGDTGWWPQVRFAADGQAHLAFCDAHNGDVRYARERAGGWRVTSVVSRGAVGKYLAMDLDTAGVPAVAYYDQDKLYLRYARPDAAGVWHEEPVAWGREVGMGAVLRFDTADVPHLFYYLPAGKLVHARRIGTPPAWDKVAVREATGVYSVRLGAAPQGDQMWVSYVDWQMRDAALHLGHVGPDGHFDSRLVSAAHGPGWHSQLLFVDGAPQVLHSYELTRKAAVSTPPPAAAGAAAAWTTRTLLAHGSTFAATTYLGRPLVAYVDTAEGPAAGTLRLAWAAARPGAPWQQWRLDDDGPVGTYLDVAVSRGGRVLVAYYADAQRSLKVYDGQL